MLYGSAPSSAFIPGHSNLLLPLADFFGVNAGKFTINEKDSTHTYFFTRVHDCITVTESPVAGISYTDCGQVPSDILKMAKKRENLHRFAAWRGAREVASLAVASLPGVVVLPPEKDSERTLVKFPDGHIYELVLRRTDTNRE